MDSTVTLTHPDGRTAKVGPKVAAFLKRSEGWVEAEAKPKATPKAKAAQADPEG